MANGNGSMESPVLDDIADVDVGVTDEEIVQEADVPELELIIKVIQ